MQPAAGWGELVQGAVHVAGRAAPHRPPPMSQTPPSAGETRIRVLAQPLVLLTNVTVFPLLVQKSRQGKQQKHPLQVFEWCRQPRRPRHVQQGLREVSPPCCEVTNAAQRLSLLGRNPSEGQGFGPPQCMMTS